MYTQNYYKKIFLLSNIKQIFCPVNVRMINLSFDELRLIAQVRNISSYENKSKEDLIKHLVNQNQNHQNLKYQNQNHQNWNHKNPKYQTLKHQNLKHQN